MQVTLKKASELQRLAIEAAGKINIRTSIPISIFGKGEPTKYVREAFEHATEAFVLNIERAFDLYEAGYEIRRLLAKANAEGSESINEILTQRALCETQEKRLATLLQLLSEDRTTEETNNVDEIASRIEHSRKAMEKGEAHYGFDRNLLLRVVSSEQENGIKIRLGHLRQDKSNLTDLLAAKNLNTKITLSDSVVKTLAAHNIIPLP